MKIQAQFTYEVIDLIKRELEYLEVIRQGPANSAVYLKFFILSYVLGLISEFGFVHTCVLVICRGGR